MEISASVGNAPKSASLETRVYKLTLTAQTQGELKWLAGLYKAIKKFTENPIMLTEEVPQLNIVKQILEG